MRSRLLTAVLLAVTVTVTTASTTAAEEPAAVAPRPLITLAADVAPGGASSRPSDLVAVGRLVYFLADSPATGQRHLWSWDGRTGRTEQLTPARSIPDACCMSELTLLDGVLYFSDERDVAGTELWRYDIASGRTELAADVVPGPSDGSLSLFTVAGGKLFFLTYGFQLQEFDPSAAGGTGQVRLIAHTRGIGSNDILGTSDILYLTGQGTQPELQRGLIAYDTRTGVFTEIPLGYSEIGLLGVVDGRVYFRLDDGGGTGGGPLGSEPWVYDPGTGQARVLADIAPGQDDSLPTEMVGLGEWLYLAADGPDDRRELWRVDPDTGRAEQAADIAPGPRGSEPAGLTVMAGKVYFRAHANTPSPGIQADVELWVFDPAARGGAGAASMVEELRTAPSQRESSAPDELTVSDGRLVFSAMDDALGTELYRYQPRAAELSAVLYGGERVSPPGSVQVTVYLRNDGAVALTGRLRLHLLFPDGSEQRRTVRAEQRVGPNDTVVVTVELSLAADAATGRYTGVLGLVDADRLTLAAGGFQFDVG